MPLQIYKININDEIFKNEIDSYLKKTNHSINDLLYVYCVFNNEQQHIPTITEEKVIKDFYINPSEDVINILQMPEPCIYKYMYKIDEYEWDWCQEYYKDSVLFLPDDNNSYLIFVYINYNFSIGRDAKIYYDEFGTELISIKFYKNNYKEKYHKVYIYTLDETKYDCNKHTYDITKSNDKLAKLIVSYKNELITGNIPYMKNYIIHNTNTNYDYESDNEIKSNSNSNNIKLPHEIPEFICIGYTIKNNFRQPLFIHKLAPYTEIINMFNNYDIKYSIFLLNNLVYLPHIKTVEINNKNILTYEYNYIKYPSNNTIWTNKDIDNFKEVCKKFDVDVKYIE